MRRADRHRLIRIRRAASFCELGSLYGGAEWEAVEADHIRDECECLGLPMGYGRVGQTPRQLTTGEARAQMRGLPKRI